MSTEHTISIATASPDGTGAGEPVSMPADRLVASNGLVTGQSGATPTESARHIATALLDAGETLFVVDPSGEFSSLAEDSDVLHVGGDRNCDVRVGPDAADRVASLALDGNTSIVLDLTAFDAGGADDLLGRVTDALVESRRDRADGILLVVDECHRWLAASGPATRTGENLVQLGGRRNDGVGIVGVTDQPADVRTDVRSGVDWVLAHRLTWQEDVHALEGMFERHHVDALDSLGDDEAIYNAGWEGRGRRVRIAPDRTETRSVTESSDRRDDGDDGLFAGLPNARSADADDPTAEDTTRVAQKRGSNGGSDADANTDADVDALREELDAMESRIASLEAKLEAREDVEALADRIATAITEGLADAEFGGAERSTESAAASAAAAATNTGAVAEETATEGAVQDEATEHERDANASSSSDDTAGGFGDVFDAFGDTGGPDRDSEPAESTASASASSTNEPSDTGSPAADGESTASADDGPASQNGDSSTGAAPSSNGSDGGMSFEPVDFSFDDQAQEVDSTVPDDFGPPSRHGTSGRTIPRYLRKIVRSIEEMDATTRRMLAHYVAEGTDSPMDAHYAAGGGGDRTRAYAHNRRLRTNGLVEHVGKGKYAPRLREYVVDQAGHSVPEHELDRAIDVIRRTVEEA